MLKGFAVPTIILLLIAGLILVYAGGFLVGKANLANILASVVYSGCQEKIAMPMYSRFECSIDQTKPVTFSGRTYLTNTGSWLADPRSRGWIQCGDEENGPQCQVKFHPRTGCVGKTEVWYRRCSSRFPENCGSWVTGVQIPTDPTVIYEDLPKGYFLEIEARGCAGYSGDDFITEWYFPYKLYLYSMGAKTEISADCSISGITRSDITTMIPIVCLVGMEGCNVNDQITTTLQPGHWVNYISNWVYGPTDLNVHYKDGKAYYCNGMEIYDIQQVTLTSGTCFQTLGSRIATVGTTGWECCPGQIFADKKCTDDWKWVSTAQAPQECFSDVQCQLGSQYAGGWSIDYSDPTQTTIARGKCINGKCNYRYETQKVECTSSSQCKTGICSNFKCVAGGGTQPPIENVAANWLINLITSFILGAIITGILLGLSLFTPLRVIPILRKLKNPKMFLIVSFIIGLIILFMYAGVVLTAKAMLFEG